MTTEGREPPPLFDDDDDVNGLDASKPTNANNHSIFCSFGLLAFKFTQLEVLGHEMRLGEHFVYTDKVETLYYSQPVSEEIDLSEDKEDSFAEANEELSPTDGPVSAAGSSQKTEDKKEINSTEIVDPQPLPSLSIQSNRGYAGSTPTVSSNAARKSNSAATSDDSDSRYKINITVKDPRKVGDGMSAYMVYKVITQTNIPDFRHSDAEVFRRFSDFLGLHEKLVEKHLHLGRIIPPPPEKSVIGMTKIKMKEESSSTEFVEQRRAALERFINAVARHPNLQTDPSLVDFLEVEGDLPRSTSTSALSSTSVLKLFSKVGDSIGKIAYKMDETDQWFDEKQKYIENLDNHLRKLHASFETLVIQRRELAQSTGMLASSVEMLGGVEEHSSLSRALSQLGSVEERMDELHVKQAEADFYNFSELIKDYIGNVQAVKDVFHERVKLYKNWKDDEATLVKKREVKARLELAHKNDKVPAANQEILEYEGRVQKSNEEFENISRSIRDELSRFERQRCTDMRSAIIAYLQSLLNHQQQVIRHWEQFVPEAKAVA